MGVATFLMFFSLNKYLTQQDSIAFLPSTIITSSKAVFEGLVGIMPLFVGMGIFCVGAFYTSHNSSDLSQACFMLFFVMNGDTVFDIIYAFN